MNWEKWLSKAPKDQIEEVIKAVRIYAKKSYFQTNLSDLDVLSCLISGWDSEIMGSSEMDLRDLIQFNPVLKTFKELNDA